MDTPGRTKATKLLWDDHRKAENIYEQFKESDKPEDKSKQAEEICRELEIHARLEEFIFYPALAHELPDAALVRSFEREHREVKRLISEVRLMKGEEGHLSPESKALVSRLMSCVQCHVAEEEAKAFPMLQADPARDEELGAALGKLRMKLQVIPPVSSRIELEVPVRMAYNQWTQFETFPQFLENVKKVRQIDASHVQWVAVIAGKEVQWTAEILEQIPDERICWRSVDGALNAGSVSFRPLTAHSCQMLVELAYEPQGVLEDLGAMLGLVNRRLNTELGKFKAFLEAQPEESGAWRGRIEKEQ